MIITHEKYQADYDRIASLFDLAEIYDTCGEIWNFLKYNLPYVIESDSEQTVKSPAAILHPGEKIDCKHYALFAGGILDSIARKYNDGWEWCYRFASYNRSKNPAHVFVMVFDGNKEIWIDPVLKSFNEKLQPNNYIDKKIMSLYALSGVGAVPAQVTVNKQLAESRFLWMVNNNFLNIKTLFKSNPDVFYGQFKNWYMSQGFDFGFLVNTLSRN